MNYLHSGAYVGLSQIWAKMKEIGAELSEQNWGETIIFYGDSS